VIEGAIIQSEQIAATVVRGNHTGKQCHNRKTRRSEREINQLSPKTDKSTSFSKMKK